MTIKIGINGFGRIGRRVFRAAVQNFSDIEIVGINDLLEPDYLAYMLQYDSVHGRFKGDVSVDGGALIVNGKKIRLTQERDPANLKWAEVGADVVIEATGLFLDKATAEKHLAAGAKKVIAVTFMSAQRCSLTGSGSDYQHTAQRRLPAGGGARHPAALAHVRSTGTRPGGLPARRRVFAVDGGDKALARMRAS